MTTYRVIAETCVTVDYYEVEATDEADARRLVGGGDLEPYKSKFEEGAGVIAVELV